MNDYILVIHGTWNVPEDKQLKWFQLNTGNDKNFCYILNRELASGPLQEAVGRQCPGIEDTFKWSGKNTHEAREDGAKELCSRLVKMRRSDPEARIHLVAHSHGGNVVLRAIELYFKELEREARRIVSHTERGDTIEKALKDVCGEGIAQAQDFRNLTDGLILPVQKATDKRSQGSFLNSVRLAASKSNLAPILRSPLYKEFYTAWSRSPQSHRLGRLVFMGTPFFYKRLLLDSRVRHGANFLVDYLASVIFSVLVYYVMILQFSGILSFLRWVDFVGFNPWEWPTWLLVVLGGLSVYVAKDLIPVEEAREFNMYYQTAARSALEWTLDDHVQTARPLDALVLSAELLDEVSIGMSIEPLVFGFLSPELKNRLTPSFWPSAPPIRSGEGHHPGRPIWLVYYYVSALVTAIFLRISRWWTQPRLTELILDTASAAGFGLPVGEFSNAVINARNDLKVDGVFEAGDVVDVSKRFAHTRSTSPPPAIPAEFDYLWDPAALEKSLKASWIWDKVKLHLDQIKARSRGAQSELGIKRLCATIDARAQEFQLFHSMYHDDKKIIQAIARFLQTAERPQLPFE